MHISLQTINYVPRVEDDGKTLRCVYEQFDSEGNSLFPGNQKDMDEVELSVDFLEKPLEDALPIERSAQVKKGNTSEIPDCFMISCSKAGEDYTIRLEFGAKPMPKPEDVTWIISTPDTQEEVRI